MAASGDKINSHAIEIQIVPWQSQVVSQWKTADIIP